MIKQVGLRRRPPGKQPSMVALPSRDIIIYKLFFSKDFSITLNGFIKRLTQQFSVFFNKDILAMTFYY